MLSTAALLRYTNAIALGVVLVLGCTCLLCIQGDNPYSRQSAALSSTTLGKPPILLIPGLLSSRLISWKKKKCRVADIEVQDIIWLNLQKMVETRTYDPHCWIDCMKLLPNGSDPPHCRVRADEGLAAIGELCPGSFIIPPGTSIFSSLLRFLANEHEYDANNLIGMPYDWRLSPMQLQTRDMLFTTMKFRLETAYKMHKVPAIVITHSMGVNLFLYFIDWIKMNDKKKWKRWLRQHVGAFVGFAAPLLGAPGSIKSVLSGHTFGLAITEAQARELELSFSSTHFLNPRSSFRNYDYTDPIAIFRSYTGSTNMSFGVEDIVNGEIFSILGSIYQDKDLANKYDSLHEYYSSDPIDPLRNSFKRPPIKHVVMVYGVDVKTEVGYSYRMQESGQPSHGGKLAPVLEEIFMEESCSDTAVIPSLPDEITPLESLCSLNDASFMHDLSEVCASPDDIRSRILRRSPVGAAVASDSRTIAIDKSCKSNIVSVSVKKRSQRRRFIKKGEMHHSGDGSVPYVSLSFAHTWLEDSEERREEHRPSTVYKEWTPLQLSGSSYPAIDLYTGRRSNGDTTVVAEIGGVDHIEITSNRYVHSIFVDPLVERIHREALDELHAATEARADKGHLLRRALHLLGQLFE